MCGRTRWRPTCGGHQRLPGGQARRGRRVRRGRWPRRWQAHRLHGRADPVGMGFRGIGDRWTGADADKISRSSRCRQQPEPARRSAAPAFVTMMRDATRRGVHLPSEDDAKIVIADPELTVGMPPVITAGTGMDALAHCLEAYCAEFYHPIATGVALEGVRLAFENLPTGVKNGNDITARYHMMAPRRWAPPPSRRGSAPSIRCRIRSARSTTRTTA